MHKKRVHKKRVRSLLQRTSPASGYGHLTLFFVGLSLFPSNFASAQIESGNESDSTHVAKPSLYRLTFEEDKELRTVTGELVATDETQGHLILDADGHLTAVAPKELKRIEEQSGTLVPTSAKEMAAKIMKLMPGGSKTIATEHFVVCYNTSDAYARWNSSLYERLYKGFYSFWKERGVQLNATRFPLVALIFETKQDYVNYASNEFDGAENTIGYYHQSTNRLASYDLTGIEGMLPPNAKVGREELIHQILMRPEAERTVATIIHEACHQISFNSGFQVRLGDNPLWLSEGIATFFESPDPKSTNGWGGAGKLNQHNFINFSRYVPQRPINSLESLLLDDGRFRATDTMTSAYAESWSLTYYLIKSKPKQFTSYLKSIREKPPGKRSSPKERIELFQQAFGDDLSKIDKDFIKFMQKVR